MSFRKIESLGSCETMISGPMSHMDMKTLTVIQKTAHKTYTLHILDFHINPL